MGNNRMDPLNDTKVNANRTDDSIVSIDFHSTGQLLYCIAILVTFQLTQKKTFMSIAKDLQHYYKSFFEHTRERSSWPKFLGGGVRSIAWRRSEENGALKFNENNSHLYNTLGKCQTVIKHQC